MGKNNKSKVYQSVMSFLDENRKGNLFFISSPCLVSEDGENAVMLSNTPAIIVECSNRPLFETEEDEEEDAIVTAIINKGWTVMDANEEITVIAARERSALIEIANDLCRVFALYPSEV